MKNLLLVLTLYCSVFSFASASNELNAWLDSTLAANSIKWDDTNTEFKTYSADHYKNAENVSDFLKQFNPKKRFKGDKEYALKKESRYPNLISIAKLSSAHFADLEKELHRIIFAHELQATQNAFTYPWVYINHVNNLGLNDTRPNDLTYELLQLKGFMADETVLFEKIGLLILARKIFEENNYISTPDLVKKKYDKTDVEYYKFEKKNESTPDSKEGNEKSLDYVEVEPVFVGGNDNMIAFIVLNVGYPEESRIMAEQGIVYVKFVVRSNGIITDVEIRKGVTKSLDEEAVRIISAMPKWIPGTQEGKPVSVNFTLPIHFRLG